jgi:hypothetical protein
MTSSGGQRPPDDRRVLRRILTGSGESEASAVSVMVGPPFIDLTWAQPNRYQRYTSTRAETSQQ